MEKYLKFTFTITFVVPHSLQTGGMYIMAFKNHYNKFGFDKDGFNSAGYGQHRIIPPKKKKTSSAQNKAKDVP